MAENASLNELYRNYNLLQGELRTTRQWREQQLQTVQRKEELRRARQLQVEKRREAQRQEEQRQAALKQHRQDELRRAQWMDEQGLDEQSLEEQHEEVQRQDEVQAKLREERQIAETDAFDPRVEVELAPLTTSPAPNLEKCIAAAGRVWTEEAREDLVSKWRSRKNGVCTVEQTEFEKMGESSNALTLGSYHAIMRTSIKSQVGPKYNICGDKLEKLGLVTPSTHCTELLPDNPELETAEYQALVRAEVEKHRKENDMKEALANTGARRNSYPSYFAIPTDAEKIQYPNPNALAIEERRMTDFDAEFQSPELPRRQTKGDKDILSSIAAATSPTASHYPSSPPTSQFPSSQFPSSRLPSSQSPSSPPDSFIQTSSPTSVGQNDTAVQRQQQQILEQQQVLEQKQVLNAEKEARLKRLRIISKQRRRIESSMHLRYMFHRHISHAKAVREEHIKAYSSLSRQLKNCQFTDDHALRFTNLKAEKLYAKILESSVFINDLQTGGLKVDFDELLGSNGRSREQILGFLENDMENIPRRQEGFRGEDGFMGFNQEAEDKRRKWRDTLEVQKGTGDSKGLEEGMDECMEMIDGCPWKLPPLRRNLPSVYA